MAVLIIVRARAPVLVPEDALEDARAVPEGAQQLVHLVALEVVLVLARAAVRAAALAHVLEVVLGVVQRGVLGLVQLVAQVGALVAVLVAQELVLLHATDGTIINLWF